MARIRTIKPDFFRHERLYEAERDEGLPLRVAFAGLWTACDREGRFRWLPRQLKLDCLPYDDVDFSRVLDALATRGFVSKYVVDGKEFGFIPSWRQHQFVNNREAISELPEPNQNNILLTCEQRVTDASTTRESNYQGERKGKEGKGNGTDADASHSDSDFLPPQPTDPKTDFFSAAKKILGDRYGGSLGNKLLQSKDGNVALAHAALLTASAKADPREYIGAIIRKRDGPESARERGDAW